MPALKMKYPKREMRSGFRPILSIFVSMAIIFAIFFLWNYTIASKIVEKNLNTSAGNLTAAAVSKLDCVFGTVQKIADNYSKIIRSSNYSKEELIHILKQEVDNNPEIYGAAMAFEPYYFDAQQKYFAPYFYRHAGDIGLKYLGDAAYDYFTMEWYQVPKDLNRPVWSEPFYDEGAGNCNMTTYSVPLYRDLAGEKQFIGILTADVSLDWLQDFMDSVKINGTGYMIAISSKGTIAIHPNRQLVVNKTIFSLADAQNSPELREIGLNMIQGRSGFTESEYKNAETGKPARIAYSPVTSNGWSIGIIFPADEFMIDVKNLFIKTLLLALGSLIIIFIVLILTARGKTGRPDQSSMDLQKKLDLMSDELKAARTQLLQSEKMASLGQLTAGIAHEIKNPLNFVNNFAELTVDLTKELSEELDKLSGTLQPADSEYLLEINNDIRSNAQKINEHGKRADSIVKGMLLHSRGDTGNKQLTDINAVLAEYVNLGYHGMRAQDNNFNIKIDSDYDDTIGMINIVPQDISRVFLNIINNACYSTNEKKKELKDAYSPILGIQTKNLGDKVEIRIRDNGKGIPQEIIDKVFNPFFTTKPAGQGTGLGLSLSNDIIVKEHGGEMKVESREGEFAEFIITIPKNLV